MRKCRYIDIFAGCGGLSLGLFNAGLSGIFAIEKNADAFNTLKNNLIDIKRHFEWVEWLPQANHDINDIIRTYKKELRAIAGSVDLIVGGPPCQGFSMAGKRNSNDIRNSLVHSYIDFVKLLLPKYIFFENVQGITHKFNSSHNDIPFSLIIKTALESIGYNVTYKLIDCSMFGIPQSRKRFIMVGSLSGDPELFFELLNKNKSVFLEGEKIQEPVTVSDAISDLLFQHGVKESSDTPKYFEGIYGDITSKYQQLMRGSCSMSASVNSHRFTKHSARIVELHQELLLKGPRSVRITPKSSLVSGLFRRGVTILDANGISPTVTSHPDDILHYCEPRILTVRELARIQSFPDWYHFSGKYTTGGTLRVKEVPRYSQVGNAVPPLFAEQVGYAFKELLNNE